MPDENKTDADADAKMQQAVALAQAANMGDTVRTLMPLVQSFAAKYQANNDAVDKTLRHITGMIEVLGRNQIKILEAINALQRPR